MARPLKKQSKKLAEMLKNKHPTTYRAYAFFYKDMLCFDPGTAVATSFALRELLEPYFYSKPELVSALRNGARSHEHNIPCYLLRVTTAPDNNIFVPFMSMFKGHVFLIGTHRNPTHEGAMIKSGNGKPKPHQLFAPVFELQSDHAMWQMFCRANRAEKFMIAGEIFSLRDLDEQMPDRKVDLQMFNWYLKGT